MDGIKFGNLTKEGLMSVSLVDKHVYIHGDKTLSEKSSIIEDYLGTEMSFHQYILWVLTHEELHLVFPRLGVLTEFVESTPVAWAIQWSL